jgi:hypothetical protein
MSLSFTNSLPINISQAQLLRVFPGLDTKVTLPDTSMKKLTEHYGITYDPPSLIAGTHTSDCEENIVKDDARNKIISLICKTTVPINILKEGVVIGHFTAGTDFTNFTLINKENGGTMYASFISGDPIPGSSGGGSSRRKRTRQNRRAAHKRSIKRKYSKK